MRVVKEFEGGEGKSRVVKAKLRVEKDFENGE